LIKNILILRQKERKNNEKNELFSFIYIYKKKFFFKTQNEKLIEFYYEFEFNGIVQKIIYNELFSFEAIRNVKFKKKKEKKIIFKINELFL
jgi:hypothetical protein